MPTTYRTSSVRSMNALANVSVRVLINKMPPRLDQTNMIDIEREGFKALDEYLASCTVIITSEAKDFNHGTGVAVRYGNQDYILTAAHVLKGEPDNKEIMLLGRPNASLKEAVQKKQIPDAI